MGEKKKIKSSIASPKPQHPFPCKITSNMLIHWLPNLFPLYFSIYFLWEVLGKKMETDVIFTICSVIYILKYVMNIKFWYFETPTVWAPDSKSWLLWKDPDAGKDWGQEEKGMTEDKMVGWHHWFNGHGFGWTPGVGEGQGGLACCSSWGHKESDKTEWLNWTEH